MRYDAYMASPPNAPASPCAAAASGETPSASPPWPLRAAVVTYALLGALCVAGVARSLADVDDEGVLFLWGAACASYPFALAYGLARVDFPDDARAGAHATGLVAGVHALLWLGFVVATTGDVVAQAPRARLGAAAALFGVLPALCALWHGRRRAGLYFAATLGAAVLVAPLLLVLADVRARSGP